MGIYTVELSRDFLKLNYAIVLKINKNSLNLMNKLIKQANHLFVKFLH